MSARVRTLSDTVTLRGGDKPDRRPRVPRRDMSILCGNPRCRIEAEYKVPKGATPRTRISELVFCSGCLEPYLERLKTSIVLPGEPCEWELTALAVENIFDGDHDHRRDFLQETCGHRACLARRGSIPALNEEELYETA